jgi:hypothetical protein
MARNKLAGTKKGKSESAKFFQNNPESRAKKNAYNTEFHATPSRRKYRAALNKANKKTGKVGDGKDLSHTKSGKLVLESQSKNRKRNGKGKGKPRLKG